VIRIVTETGADAAAGMVGEITVRSPSMFSGYRNSPEQTEAAVRDGWYFTGDYGFVDQGEYFIVGRKKDLIIVAGKNLFPEDIEAEVSVVEGILPGRVVAFGVTNDVTGTEEAWVLAETEADAGFHDAIRSAAIRAAMAIDVTIARMILVPPRWLIKSSAGKLSRSANRERIVEQLRTGSTA
jgi:acyl-CoA synthetase (AMP-forming)/AMP-acid ligase II